MISSVAAAAPPITTVIAPFDPTKSLSELGQKCIRKDQLEVLDLAITKHKGRCINSTVMGGGKTFQSAAFHKHYGGERGLIIVPANRITDTVDEYLKWTNTILIPIRSGEDARSLDFNPATFHSNIVISIDLCKTLPEILKFPWKVVVVDEAHRLRGKDSQRGHAFLPTLHRAKYVFLLTGTPIVSAPSDVFNLLHALDPRKFHNRFQFISQYCGAFRGKFGLEEPKVLSKEQSVKFHLMLKQYMVRLKGVHNPEFKKNRHIIRIGMPSDVEFPEVPKGLTGIALEHAISQIYLETGRLKQPYIREHALKLIKQLPENEHAVVFYHQQVVGDDFGEYLTENDITYIRIDGSVSQARRKELLQPLRDSQPGSARVALLSLCSSSESIECQPGCTISIFIEMPWGGVEQAEHRIHRLGMKKDTNAYWLIAHNTFDDCMPAIAKRKKRNDTELVDGDCLLPSNKRKRDTDTFER